MHSALRRDGSAKKAQLAMTADEGVRGLMSVDGYHRTNHKGGGRRSFDRARHVGVIGILAALHRRPETGEGDARSIPHLYETDIGGASDTSANCADPAPCPRSLDGKRALRATKPYEGTAVWIVIAVGGNDALFPKIMPRSSPEGGSRIAL